VGRAWCADQFDQPRNLLHTDGPGRTGVALGDGMRVMIAASAAGRVGTPDDIAAAAEFLLGPHASFITGTDVLVDGGVTAAMMR
jgi:NAD(P)-dependent dehydrogenase (short-subunit alcohol dehydrogenase family)